jgi:hypothetical protein
MSLLSILIFLVVIGLIYYLFNTIVPLPPVVRRIINIALIVIAVVYLLKALGVWAYLASFKI